jgi:hypothetical protein
MPSVKETGFSLLKAIEDGGKLVHYHADKTVCKSDMLEATVELGSELTNFTVSFFDLCKVLHREGYEYKRGECWDLSDEIEKRLLDEYIFGK